MARLSFSRWPSLFFFDFQAPSVRRPHLLHRSRRKKHPRNRCKIRPMGQKIPTLPRRTRQKPQSAAGVLRLYVSPSKAVDNYSKSMLKPPLLQKNSQLRGQFILISQIATFQEKVCREKQSHIFGRHRWQTASRSYRITWDCISRTFDKVFYYRCET